MEESEDNGNRYDVEGEGEIEVPNIRLKKRCLPSNLCWKTLLWSGFAMAYLLFGGLIFTLAERPNELDRIDTAQMEREETRRQLELLINQTIATIVNFTNGTVNETQATALVGGVANVSAVFALTFLKLQRETSPLWTYSSAVFFASTVITTIGYGNTAPVTSAGRTLFVFYALIGIPLFLIFVGYVGQILSWYMDAIIKRMVGHKERPPSQQKSVTALIVLLIFVGGLILFIFFPSLIFYGIEDWTYGEAIYYCFVTLTTVGFGDFVPAQQSGSDSQGIYRICTAAWIIFGLAWLSLLLARIQGALEKTGSKSVCEKVKEKRMMKADQSKELANNQPLSEVAT